MYFTVAIVVVTYRAVKQMIFKNPVHRFRLRFFGASGMKAIYSFQKLLLLNRRVVSAHPLQQCMYHMFQSGLLPASNKFADVKFDVD